MHEYIPGRLIAVVGESAVALLDPSLGIDDARRMWDVDRDGSRLSRWIELLAGRGITTLPPFALVEAREEGLFVLVRGDLTVRAGDRTVTGTGYSTWYEEIVPGATELVIEAPGVDAGSEALPVANGIVYADRIATRAGGEVRGGLSVAADVTTDALADEAPVAAAGAGPHAGTVGGAGAVVGVAAVGAVLPADGSAEGGESPAPVADDAADPEAPGQWTSDDGALAGPEPVAEDTADPEAPGEGAPGDGALAGPEPVAEDTADPEALGERETVDGALAGPEPLQEAPVDERSTDEDPTDEDPTDGEATAQDEAGEELPDDEPATDAADAPAEDAVERQDVRWADGHWVEASASDAPDGAQEDLTGGDADTWAVDDEAVAAEDALAHDEPGADAQPDDGVAHEDELGLTIEPSAHGGFVGEGPEDVSGEQALIDDVPWGAPQPAEQQAAGEDLVQEVPVFGAVDQHAAATDEHDAHGQPDAAHAGDGEQSVTGEQRVSGAQPGTFAGHGEQPVTGEQPVFGVQPGHGGDPHGTGGHVSADGGYAQQGYEEHAHGELHDSQGLDAAPGFGTPTAQEQPSWGDQQPVQEQQSWSDQQPAQEQQSWGDQQPAQEQQSWGGQQAESPAYPAAGHEAEHDGATTMGGIAVGEYGPALALVLPDGTRIAVDRPILLGRAPDAARFSGDDVPRLVQVRSPERDVSATHVEVRSAGDSVVVTDMDSTNGTVIVLPDQPAFRLHPRTGVPVPPGAYVELGTDSGFHVEAAGQVPEQ